MRMSKGMILSVAVVVMSLSGECVRGDQNHVVGGDRGWDPTSDLVSWSQGRLFRVGDQICKSFFFFFTKYPIFCSTFLLNYSLSVSSFLYLMKNKNDGTCFCFYTCWYSSRNLTNKKGECK